MPPVDVWFQCTSAPIHGRIVIGNGIPGESMHASLSDKFFVVFMSLSALLGLIALVSPRVFQRLATQSKQWVDTEKYLAVLDRRIDVDSYFLRHCRVLGALVMVSVSIMGYLWMSR